METWHMYVLASKLLVTLPHCNRKQHETLSYITSRIHICQKSKKSFPKYKWSNVTFDKSVRKCHIIIPLWRWCATDCCAHSCWWLHTGDWLQNIIIVNIYMLVAPYWRLAAKHHHSHTSQPNNMYKVFIFLAVFMERHFTHWVMMTILFCQYTAAANVLVKSCVWEVKVSRRVIYLLPSSFVAVGWQDCWLLPHSDCWQTPRHSATVNNYTVPPLLSRPQITYSPTPLIQNSNNLQSHPSYLDVK